MPETSTTRDMIPLTAEIVGAYVSHNSIWPQDLVSLIDTVHGALCGLAKGSAVETSPAPAADTPSPAEIRKSIRPDGLVSFLDGRSYKTLKRHLTAYGLTPDGYRQRFGLPADYPLVCPSYSARRSSLAKAMMLGVPGSRAKLQAAE